MMSPFWNPRLAAVPSSARSVTTTPSVSASRCSSSATAGEMLATFAPWNCERTRDLHRRSGALPFDLRRPAERAGRKAVIERIGIVDRLAVDLDDQVGQ